MKTQKKITLPNPSHVMPLPAKGMYVTQRRAELNGAQFLAVRTLACFQYRKANGEPLMTYQETLDNRELVKTTIINYEVERGLLLPTQRARRK